MSSALQLLAHGRACPLDEIPLPYDNIAQFKPNYSLMQVVSAFQNTDNSHRYQLEPGHLKYDTNAASWLGEGGSGTVYRGVQFALSLHGPPEQIMLPYATTHCSASHNSTTLLFAKDEHAATMACNCRACS